MKLHQYGARLRDIGGEGIRHRPGASMFGFVIEFSRVMSAWPMLKLLERSTSLLWADARPASDQNQMLATGGQSDVYALTAQPCPATSTPHPAE
jgi:hypothetical protein